MIEIIIYCAMGGMSILTITNIAKFMAMYD
jgi:hypothetical protein